MSVQAPPQVSEPSPTPTPSSGPQPPRRASVGAVTVGVTLIVLGGLGLLSSAGVDVSPGVVAPILLLVIGAGVAIAGIRGEREGGLLGLSLFVGVLLLMGSLLTQVLDVPMRGSIGDRTYAPTSASELDEDYRLLMGSLTVDLRDLELPTGTTELEVSVGMGEVEVLLPDDMPVEVDASVAAGSAVVLGRTRDGVGVDNRVTSDGYADASRRLSLRVRVGLGEARV